MKYETVIGLEVHAELSTKSKIFCACTTAYGGEPNTHVCPVCSGMPGVLPVLNRNVVEYAIRLGTALNCTITQHCKFDRKNYFYPDLPKAYQVSQLYEPICKDGYLEIEVGSPNGGAKKKIGIREIHMEEDAGKLIHDPKGANTLMDFNRCGVPLLEIVTHPDFRNGAEVIAYLEKLRETLLYLGICDCKMQEGSMRADINLSLRQPGGEFGVRTETKNMNSFKAIGRAIEYEIARQTDILEDGGTIEQETRRWDDERGTSSGMRSKENAQDYRYFPDPDLLPIEIDDAWLARVKDSLPELAHQKRERYAKDFGISEATAQGLTTHKNISDLFEVLVAKNGAGSVAETAKEAANLITGEIMRLSENSEQITVSSEQEAVSNEQRTVIDIDKISVLINLVTSGKINRNAYKETVEAVIKNNVDPEKYIAEKGLIMINDDSAIVAAVEAVITEEADSVADFKAGKEKVFGFLMGQVMKKLKGQGNPEIAKKMLTEKLQN